MKPRIGGWALDPQADLALPLLLLLGVTMTTGLGGWAVVHWLGEPLISGLAAAAGLFAAEGYLFTTVFTVRDVDAPGALRWVEVGLMALLAKLLATWSVASGFVQALTGGAEALSTWAGLGLLGYAWFQGGQIARHLQYLHPGRLAQERTQDTLARNDHAQAFAAVRSLAFGQVAGLAVVLGLGAWLRGDVRLWGWSWLSFGLLVQTLLAAGALLVAAQLKVRITWLQERLTANPAVFARWTPIGLSLLLVPLLAALLLPAGPRLPAEYLVRWINRAAPGVPIDFPEPPKLEAPKSPFPPEMTDGMGDPWVRWTWHLPGWVWWLMAALPVLWLLRAAARQLIDRLGAEELHGIWRVLAAVAAWYLALWQALREVGGGVLRQAVATPAAALGALLGEAGAVGRFLPRTGRAPADPRAALRHYFARLQAEAGRKGLRRAPGVTAAAYSQQLSEAAPAQAAEIAALTRSYEAARYSTAPVEAEAVGFARRAWATIARSIKRK